MREARFIITADEVRRKSRVKLTDQQVKDILSMIENDEGLWNDIERSIQCATGAVLHKLL